MRGLVERHYARTPVYGLHYLEYRMMRDQDPFGPGVDPADLVRVLMAPEPMAMQLARTARTALNRAALPLARTALRNAGESFVVRDGVNPLIELVRPVVEALNAPGCAGLEAAFRALGVDVPDVERDALEALAAQWRDELMSGELAGGGASAILGKLSVALGVDGFNAFVEVYNEGTGGDGNDAR